MGLLRLYAVLLGRRPLLGLLPGLLAGEAAGLAPSSLSMAIIGVSFSLVAALLSPSILIRSALPFVLGFGLSKAALPPPAPLFISALPLEARVISEPRHRQSGEISFIAEVSRVYSGTEKEGVNISGLYLCRGPFLPWKNAASLAEGDGIILQASFSALRWKSFFDYDGSLARRGISGRCRISFLDIVSSSPPLFSRIRTKIRAAVEEVLGQGEYSGLLLQMAFGFRDLVSTETERAIARVGGADLLVVSGYQVTLVFYLAERLAYSLLGLWPRLLCCGLAGRLSAVVGLILSAAFLGIAGVEDSGLRAGLALGFFALGRFLSEKPDIWGGIVFALFWMNFFFPGSFLDAGSELTFAALIGIALGLTLFTGKLSRLFGAAILASTATGLVLCFWFPELSLIGLILHPIFSPILSFAACEGGFFALLIKMAGIDPGGAGLKLAAAVVWRFRAFAFWGESLSWSYLELTGISRAASALVLAALILGAAAICLRRSAAQSGIRLVDAQGFHRS